MEFNDVPALVGKVFWIAMDVINLKEKRNFIEQYVNLRNKYKEQLLSLPINIFDTKKWLDTTDAEIRGIVEESVLLGICILHLNRNGEIGFFVKDKNKGIGAKLLNIIEKVALEKKLGSVWAWVLEDNAIAQHVFEKKSFLKEGISKKEYLGIVKQGVTYRKYLKER